MPDREVLIAITSNNSDIEKNFLDKKIHNEVRFVNIKKNDIPYLVFIIDLQRDLTQISQNIIGAYEHCQSNGIKLAVVLLHGKNIDTEKNHYFQKMLDDLGKEKPLHRLIYTKDLYQQLHTTPSTPFDNQIHQIVTTGKINISQKGENLFFPLSLEDFINAINKTLFLSNTAGKTFWILGDAIKDLELAYLLKKNISAYTQDELEINAEEKNDNNSNALISIGNRSRGELNWQPEKEIEDDLRKIVESYHNHLEAEETQTNKINPIHKFLLWLYKPRPKKGSSLPTVKKITKKILIYSALAGLIYLGTGIVTTVLSLKQLNSSINSILEGDINQSVRSLNKANNYKEIGESVFVPIIPIANIISQNETEKIFNIFSFINYSATSLGNLHQTYVMAENLLLSLDNPETQVNYSDLSLALHSNLSQIYENLNHISFLSSGNKLPEYINEKIQSNSDFKNLKKLEEQVSQYIKIIDIIPEILSNEKSKNLLILVQNRKTLQPSGGETQYFLHININKGSIISKTFYTVSEIENLYKSYAQQTKTNTRFIAPPEPTLKDITQKPDFTILSRELFPYLEKALKVKADFIIAINDSLIEQLLQEEKSQIVDELKLDLLVSSESAVYKDVLNQYIERLFKQDLSLPVIGRTLAKSIGDNQVYIWSSDTNTQRLLMSQSYSGAIIPRPCNAGITSSNECIAETTYLSESILNPRGQNEWSNRQINHAIEITSTSILHDYKIDYTLNPNYSLAQPINLVYHLYLSAPSNLNQILLNDLPASMKNVEKTNEGALDHYQIPLTISSDKDIAVILKTSTINGNNFSLPLSYSITEYRQPGTSDPGIALKVKYPENLRPTIVTSQFEAKPSEMSLILPPHTSTFGFKIDHNTQ